LAQDETDGEKDADNNNKCEVDDLHIGQLQTISDSESDGMTMSDVVFKDDYYAVFAIKKIEHGTLPKAVVPKSFSAKNASKVECKRQQEQKKVLSSMIKACHKLQNQSRIMQKDRMVHGSCFLKCMQQEL